MKLRTKILLLLLPPVIMPLLVLGWIAYGQQKEVTESKLFGTMRTTLEHLSTDLDEKLQTAKANIQLFSANTLLKKYVLTSDAAQRYSLLQSPLLRVFKSFQDAYPDYYEIRVLLPDGYEDIRRTTSYIENVTEEEGENPLFHAMAAAGDGVFSAVYRNPDNGMFSLFLGKPLILRDPSVDPIGVKPSLRGYLVITVSLEPLRAQLATQRIGATGYLRAVDARGVDVFADDGSHPIDAVPETLLRAVSKRKTPAAPVRRELLSQEYLISGVQPHPGLHLLALLPLAEMHRSLLKLGMAVSGITLVTIVLTSVCLYLVLQYLVIAPIQKLRALSKEIGRGNLDIRSELSSQDEIGDLGTAFEDMAGSLRRSDEQIRFVAYHDSLTGLPNRAMFKQYLGHVIAQSKRSARQFALLFLDVDDFKRVNDTLGHQAGDLLLQEVTDRLSKCLRASDEMVTVQALDEPDEILARLGGDEFVILLPDIPDAHAPSALAGRLLEVLSKPIFIQGSEVYIGASIGITLFPLDGEEADELIKNADIAMYHAKELGKNDYQYFRESMNQMAHERMALEHKLRKALENNQLSLHYQPQVDVTSCEIVGLEALLRWEHPEDGMIPPCDFIPVAEQTGLIVSIGEWVLREACRQSRAWQKAGLQPVMVSVNISSIQFARQDVSELIRQTLARTGLDPHYFEIEITESSIMSQPERAIKDLSLIRDQGVSIALDDFGTGYSSFSYLHRFPIDTLKIDRSFVKELGENRDHNEIVAAMIAMAHTLNLRVVAEGIETRPQFSALADFACDIIQGYYFSKPVPAAQVPDLLRRRALRIA